MRTDNGYYIFDIGAKNINVMDIGWRYNIFKFHIKSNKELGNIPSFTSSRVFFGSFGVS